MGTVVTTPDTGHYRSGRDGLPVAHQPGQLSELPRPSTSGPRRWRGHGRWLVSDSQEIDMARPAGHPGVRTKNTLLLSGEVGAHPAHPLVVHAPPAPPRVRHPWTGDRHRPPAATAPGPGLRRTPRFLPRALPRGAGAFLLWTPGRQGPTNLAHGRGASFRWGAEHGGQHHSEHPPHVFAPSLAAFAVPPARLLHDLLLVRQVGITPRAGVRSTGPGHPFSLLTSPEAGLALLLVRFGVSVNGPEVARPRNCASHPKIHTNRHKDPKPIRDGRLPWSGLVDGRLGGREPSTPSAQNSHQPRKRGGSGGHG
ncbi:hypothetical protein DFP74_0595 [Nocardiopsis sp. Huas11]|nr:hypothetical protein DFP74_0595 [Nocardiopsis sp. Huas11]